MSEIKRATLIPFTSEKSEEKKTKLAGKTVRISLVLPESNEGTCPVYNYKEELAVGKKKDKNKLEGKHVNNGKHINGLDTFDEEDDDDVRRIAQEMEAKYGMGPPTNTKRKGRKDDYADIGMGYDESDSFIDNTDGYDEMIPQNVTTLFGGFYINCGALEFKTDEKASSEIFSSSSSSEDEDETSNVNSSRKRVIISSSSEDETETDKVKEHEKEVMAVKKRKIDTDISGQIVTKKKKLLTPEKIRQLKKIPNNSEDNNKKIVKETSKEKENKEAVNTLEIISSSSDERQDNEEVVLKENKNPSVDTINDIINLVVAKGTVKDKEDNSNKSTVSNHSQSGKPVISISDDNSNSNPEKKQEQNVKLPENLPENVLEIVTKLKETASMNAENNAKLFNDTTNNLLLSLERSSRCLGKPSKSKIYHHLAPYLKCRKETILRRAKKLVLESDKNRISKMVLSLKAKIDVIMPPLLENYERESQKVVQKKFSKDSFDNEENKQLRMPKRRFTWNEETKKLFKEIIFLRKRCFLLEGKSKETLEDEMKNYLKNDVKVLWPDGWMSITALFKMYTNFNERKNLLNKNSSSLVVSDLEISPIPNKERQKLSGEKPKQPNFTKDTLQMSSSSNNNTNNHEIKNISTKDIEKITSSSTLSITPILPNQLDAPKPKSVKNELSINLIESDNTKSNLNINFTKPSTPEPQTKTIDTSIKSLKEPLPRNDNLSEKVATFINLPQKTIKTEKLVKPNKPPTDHKIENIIGTSKPEKVKTSFNLLENKLEAFNKTSQDLVNNLIHQKEKSQPKPENLVKGKSDNSSDKLPLLPENLSTLKLVKVLPENLIKLKHDSMAENLSKPKLNTDNSDNKLNRQQEKSIKVKSMSELKGKSSLNKFESVNEVIILDDSIMDPIKEIKPVEKKSEPQIIDLTSGSDLKRKIGPKSKIKYHDASIMKPRITASEQNIKRSAGLTGNVSIDNLLQDNLVEAEQYYNSKKKPKISETMKEIKPSLNSIHKQFNDGDDIQKVMEDLKVLQNMVTPVKNSDSLTPSPVSVIAFNTNYMPKKSTHDIKPELKPDIGLGFQDAFQKQFLNLKSMGINSTTATSSKNFTSCHSNSLPSLPDKFYSNSNNNYNQHNSAKYKTNYSTQQQGTYNLMDDMLANFITEYAYPKTANHKPKPSQK